MNFEKMIKKLDVLDMALVKMSVFAFALFAVAYLPEFAAWVQSTNPLVFLAAWVVFAARPFYRAYIKK